MSLRSWLHFGNFKYNSGFKSFSIYLFIYFKGFWRANSSLYNCEPFPDSCTFEFFFFSNLNIFLKKTKFCNFFFLNIIIISRGGAYFHNVTCLDVHYGPLCQVCSRSFTINKLLGTCDKCPPFFLNILGLVLSFIGYMIFYLYLIR